MSNVSKVTKVSKVSNVSNVLFYWHNKLHIVGRDYNTKSLKENFLLNIIVILQKGDFCKIVFGLDYYAK